jgi:hypothetical protein
MQAAYEVACNLRPDDYREVVEGHGHDPKLTLPIGAKQTDSVYFTSPAGVIAGAAGVGNNGEIWMLCTPVISTFPITFAREAKRYIESRPEELLWNIADKRNTTHLKLLKFLGFKFLRELTHGPNNLTFIEFCRVRTR